MRWGIHSYDLDRYNFSLAVSRLFDVSDLSSLTPEDAPMIRPSNARPDQNTGYHARFYAAFPEVLDHTYHDFVHEVAVNIMDTHDIYYQSVPTLRIHFPDSVAVAEFHCDKDYNHQAGEVNFWVPLTAAWGTNTVWLESSPGRGDYHPVDVSIGQVYVFDGVHLRHGNKANQTGAARVSFDFRCIPRECYVDQGHRSVSAGMRMSIGEYFSIL